MHCTLHIVNLGLLATSNGGSLILVCVQDQLNPQTTPSSFLRWFRSILGCPSSHLSGTEVDALEDESV